MLNKLFPVINCFFSFKENIVLTDYKIICFVKWSLKSLGRNQSMQITEKGQRKVHEIII